MISCNSCSATVFLSDGLRLYERIDDEQGAGAIMAYLLNTLEQLVFVIADIGDFVVTAQRSVKPACR